MADNSKNTGSSSQSSVHKSQGMRTRSKSEKMAREDAIADQIIEDLDADRTIRIDSTRAKGMAQNSKAADESTQENKTVSEKVSKVFEEERSAGADGLGISVYVSRDEIPAYEIGLSSGDLYVTDEIISGKVSKISEEQLSEMEAEALKKKRRKAAPAGTKRNGKKKMTPTQKALRAVIWVAFWAVVFLCAYMCYRVGYEVFYDTPVNSSSTSTIEYTVEAGATDETVYEDLTRLGVIDCSEFIYKLRALVFKADYVEGTYTISSGYNTEKIINILAGYNYTDDDD